MDANSQTALSANARFAAVLGQRAGAPQPDSDRARTLQALRERFGLAAIRGACAASRWAYGHTEASRSRYTITLDGFAQDHRGLPADGFALCLHERDPELCRLGSAPPAPCAIRLSGGLDAEAVHRALEAFAPPPELYACNDDAVSFRCEGYRRWHQGALANAPELTRGQAKCKALADTLSGAAYTDLRAARVHLAYDPRQIDEESGVADVWVKVAKGAPGAHAYWRVSGG